MNAEDINSIITGTVSTTPGPIGGPSNTPAPWGTNDTSATTQPGSGTGAPTPMPKQDSSSTFVQFGTDVRSARQAMLEARNKLETADTILNILAAELRASSSNPKDRQLRADQLTFFQILWQFIDQAKERAVLAEKPDDQLIAILNQVDWIARRIQQL